MHQFVQITDAQQTPYITENGYQKVIISLKASAAEWICGAGLL